MPECKAKDDMSTVAIVVTYHPCAERLVQCVTAVLPQVDEVVLVDNGSAAPILDMIALTDRVTVLKLDSNRGIGHAQNVGIEWARSRKAGLVLLLDQDSVADEHMVPRLQRRYEQLAESGVAVGAVGPAHVDDLGVGRPKFTRFHKARYLQVEAPLGLPTLACDMLIASGTMIPVAVLDKVGPMNEGLFIDKVDTEWCLRVRRAGLGIYGVPDARLFHRLGESVLHVRWWRGKRLPVHKPFRYYYMVRNSILLQRMPKLLWAWRLADMSQILQIILFHGLLAPGSRLNRPMILRGLRDGFRGLLGPMPSR
jgi:rhamnosyltransferase